VDINLSESKLWQDRILNGLRYQQKVGRSKEWATYKNYYRHEFKPGTLPVNIMYSILRSLTPQVVLRNPKITVTPRKGGAQAELNARIVQKLDNWLLYELMTKRELKKMVADCFFCGTASAFVGYDSQFGFDPSLASPDGSYSLSQFDKKGDRIEINQGVNPGMPWFLRARPEDVVFPWGATDTASLDWVAMRVFRRVSDLKADKKYNNTSELTGDVTPVRTAPDGGNVVDFQDANQFSPDPDAQWVELWQIHDARTGKIKAVTMNSTKLLRNDVDDMQIEGLPIENVTFNPDPDYIYGIPDARIIEPQLLELIDIRTQAMKHRQRDLMKALIKKGTLPPEELQKLASNNIGAFVEIDTEGGLRDCVVPFTPGVSGILNDLNTMGSIVQGDVREMVGFSRVLQGDYQGKTHVSAAETDAVMQSLNIRLDERRDAMADLLTKVVRKFNQYIFTYWTADRVESIVGPDGAKWWLKFNGPAIKDEYDLMIEPEEGRSLNTQSKRQQFMEVAKVWAELNAGAIAQGQPVPPEIQRALFGQYDDIGLDIDRLIAQNGAASKSMQIQQMMGGMGASAQNPISAGQLAQIQGAGRG
jgi:hypothetical protein